MKYPLLKSLSIALILSALGACAVGPDYVPPEPAVPAQFKYQDGWQTVSPQSWAAQGAWWQAFADPALDAPR